MKVLRKLKKKFNIIGNGEDREIKYQNWSRRKLLRYGLHALCLKKWLGGLPTT